MGRDVFVYGIDIETWVLLLIGAIFVVWFGVCLVKTIVGTARRPRKMWLTWLAALVMSAISIALFFPASAAVREAGPRSQCSNNLKQIALAMLNYEHKYGCFPPAYVADKEDRPMHSWRVLLLPFMDNQRLYDRYRFDEPWNSPRNRALANNVPRVGREYHPIYHCPDDRDSDKLDTSYVMVVAPRMISDGPTSTSLKGVTDGTGNTILIVEMSDSGIPWMEPRDLKFDEMTFKINDPERMGIRSKHRGGANVVFCDNSLHFIKDSVDPEALKGLLTRNGGDP